VGTYRSDELHRRHPLLAWVGELDRAGVERVDLQALDRESMRTQIEAIVGERPDQATLDTIAHRSGGNPFFAEELGEAGTGSRRHSRTTLARGPPVPRRAPVARGHGAHRRRRRRRAHRGPRCAVSEALDTDEAALKLAASRGRWAAPAGIPPRTSPDPLSFRHALLQEAVYDDLLPRDRRRLHARFAAVGCGRGRRCPEPRAQACRRRSRTMRRPHTTCRCTRRMGGCRPLGVRAPCRGRVEPRLFALPRLWDVVPPEGRPPGLELPELLYEASFALAGIATSTGPRPCAARRGPRRSGRHGPVR